MTKRNFEVENAEHIEVLNHEMGIVQQDIAVIKTDLKWIKQEMSRLTQVGIAIALTLFGAFITKVIGMW